MKNYKETSSWSLLEQALKEATEIKTPELTVDLPHNQKLTIGSLKPNTIVEIATWKGTGVPDENSVRMLIGASLQNGEEMIAESSAGQLDESVEIVEPQELVISEDASAITPTRAESFDVPRTLPLGGPSTQKAWNMIQTLASKPRSNAPTEFQKEMGRKAMRKNIVKRTWRFRAISSAAALTAVALIIGGLNVGGFLAFTHPQVGPDLPFGNANSALTAIVPGSQPSMGDLAIATISGVRNLVRVDAVNESVYTVSTMAGQSQITEAELDGKISFLIPFMGYLWLPFGQ